MEDRIQQSQFKNNKEANQFELHVGNHFAFIEYYIKENKLFLTHTEAPQELKGTGAAAKLVEHVLQYCKDNSLKVVPLCPYVASYIDKNPQWRIVLSEGYQM